ncbi:MAG: Fe-S-cluster-containing dehydrogenase component [Chlamydiales bacterium]
MQLGFVIDHTRCIGCHACTVACKSENEVPVGNFRTWVKYTEAGTFPDVRRSFAVLRCNQCTDAPCMTICPTSALTKRSDGIVDLNQDHCIGCKACMHGCPYDALYLNEDTGTAEKCHFCAHRTERGLAPACAVVCPTEAIIPGDFHDPNSRVSQLRKEHDLAARKPEAGTGPNVLYREVDEAGIDPGKTNLSKGFIWSQPPSGALALAQEFEAMESQAKARTVYDVPRQPLWGNKIVGYLYFKSLAAGIFPIGLLAIAQAEGLAPWQRALVPLAALAFLGLTCLLLVLDLKRPDRFLMILLRPNWNSWLARGTYAITIYSLMLVSWIFLALSGHEGDVGGDPYFWLTTATGALTACYTGWLFAQAKGRVLWMRRGSWAHLLVQAVLAGAAALVFLEVEWVRGLLLGSLVAQAGFMLTEHWQAPKGRGEEYQRAHNLVARGPFARVHWRVGMLIGVIIPVVCLVVPVESMRPTLSIVAAVCALVGLYSEERTWVLAGQSLPIS